MGIFNFFVDVVIIYLVIGGAFSLLYHSTTPIEYRDKKDALLGHLKPILTWPVDAYNFFLRK